MAPHKSWCRSNRMGPCNCGRGYLPEPSAPFSMAQREANREKAKRLLGAVRDGRYRVFASHSDADGYPWLVRDTANVDDPETGRIRDKFRKLNLAIKFAEDLNDRLARRAKKSLTE